MPEVTTTLPSLGVNNYFTFKDPFATYFRLNHNVPTTPTSMKVVSIVDMMDMIKNDQRDPYTNIYLPVDISESEFKVDITNSVPIISLLYVDVGGVEHNLRVPLNYIDSIGDVFNIPYMNKLIVIDLNYLPESVTLTEQFDQLRNFIRQAYGVVCDVKEVSLGSPLFIDKEESSNRETVRNNLIMINKTDKMKYAEIEALYNDLLNQYLALRNS